MDPRQEPVTKADLAELRSELKGDTAELRSGMQALEERVVEMMRETETHLLKAFYDFAEANHKRVTVVEQSHAGMTDRVGLLEHRVTQIEKRLNWPPAS